MAKSPDAFRTISEVAEWLDRPAHVLRFWESKFPQVKPVKRAGGRRYYRPQDMLLLGGIKQLLHDDGLTIKGVQKILREQGVAYVSELSQMLDDISAEQLDEALRAARAEAAETVISHPAPPAPMMPADDAPGAAFSDAADEAPMSVDLEPDSGTVVAFNRSDTPEPPPTPKPAAPAPEAPMDLFSHGGASLPDTPAPVSEPEINAAPEPETAGPDATPVTQDASNLPSFITDDPAPEPVAPDVVDPAPDTPMQPVTEAMPDAPAPEPVAPMTVAGREDAADADVPGPVNAAPDFAPEPEPYTPSAPTAASVDAVEEYEEAAEIAADFQTDPEFEPTPEPVPAAAPSITAPDLPDPPADDEIEADPGLLTAIARAVQDDLPPPDADKIAPLLERLAALSTRMQAARKP